MAHTHIRHIEEIHEAGAEVLVAFGEFDHERAIAIEQRIAELAARGVHRFVVDLSHVDAIAPEAVAPLLEAARRREPENGRVSVVFDPFLTVFAVDGLDDLFDVAVTRDDALRRIRA
jgi:anti-anti-sigma factor